MIDHAMAARLPGPRTATGEDIVEFHVHGSRAVVGKLLDVLGRMPGLRPASPGEFTRRAFANGKMDLTAVEALGDLLNADTDAQRKLALRAFSGADARLYDGWRSSLVSIAAHVEATIDFVDDVDAYEAGGSGGVVGAVRQRTCVLLAAIRRHLDTGRNVEVIREGVSVGIFGAPNAGKSSLLNLLVRRPAAIVSPIPGTTRDVLEAHMDLGGLPVSLADTAGLRAEADAADDVEREGIRRALDRVARSDLTLCVVDVDILAGTTDVLLDFAHLVGSPETSVIVLNKADKRVPEVSLQQAEGAMRSRFPSHTILRVSCIDELGIDALLAALRRMVQERYGRTADDGAEISSPMLMRDRHRVHLERCATSLEAFLAPASPLDAAAEELRLAIRELGAITGRVDVEEVLDALFSTFCIGK